jgi:hypothetical protein
VGCCFAALPCLFLVNADLVDQHTAETAQMREGNNATKYVWHVCHGQKDSAYVIPKNNGKVHVPILLAPFLHSFMLTHSEGFGG